MNCPSCQSEAAPGTVFCRECGARLPQEPPPLKVLQERYVLTKKLGQGGMGSVFLATDRRLSTARWAVKELTDVQITSPLERERAAESFRQEAEMLAGLSHPNLPRVTDSFTQDGRNYLVMEFIPGESLEAYLEQAGLPRPIPEVMAWARQLCEVLTYLHTQHPPVIFRDLKPGNIIVTPDGTLRLIDFGIARHFKPGQSRDTQAFGTVGYSAPEQYGQGQTDARSDVYSLSVMLHQMLTGYDPSNTPFRLPPAAQVNRTVPIPISNVLARGMQNDPAQRFASIADFRQALFGTGNLVQPQHDQMAVRPAVGPMLNPAGAGAIPLQATAPPAGKSTGLAVTAKRVGLISIGLMGLGAVIAVLGISDPKRTLIGFGSLLAMPSLVLGPLAIILGLVAFFQKATKQTTRGQSDATIGIATGMLTLLLCCGLLWFIGARTP